MATKVSLFNNYKSCEICRRPLPDDYDSDTCPVCAETLLFQEVKEYIRENDVNEYDVAKHFNISKHQVKAWIKEGRIEYKENVREKKIAGLHCQKCGAPVNFGTLCPNCFKELNGNKFYAVNHPKDENENKMRFVDK